MEHKLAVVAYWTGIVSTVLALILRGLAVLGVFVFPSSAELTGGKIPISYRTFLEGAVLFFTMAIASAVMMWAKGQRA